MRDAIEWTADGADLLPLVPRHWMQQAMQNHLTNYVCFRERRREKEVNWFSDVDVGAGFKGVRLLSANGEVPYHVDPDFPKYGYLLVVRPVGYAVTGLKWRGDRPQPAGTLMCFHQCRRQHALVKLGRDEKDMKELSKMSSMWMSSSPGRLWMGLIWDSDILVGPEEAAAEFRDTLEQVAAQRRRLAELHERHRLSAE